MYLAYIKNFIDDFTESKNKVAEIVGFAMQIVGAILVVAAIIGVIAGTIATLPVVIMVLIGTALIAFSSDIKQFLSNWNPFKKKEEVEQAMANGGIARGGITLVGERGPELLNLPRGAKVSNNRDTKSMLKNTGNVVNNTFNITVNAKDSSKQEMRRMADEIGRMVSSKINRSTSSSTFR